MCRNDSLSSFAYTSHCIVLAIENDFSSAAETWTHFSDVCGSLVLSYMRPCSEALIILLNFNHLV